MRLPADGDGNVTRGASRALPDGSAYWSGSFGLSTASREEGRGLMPGRRRLFFAGIVSMALAAASIVSVQAGSATTPPGRLVNVRHLPAAPAVGIARALPFLTRNPRTLASTK